MPATETPATIPPQNRSAADPAIFKILDDGTVLYKTYQQAQEASRLLKGAAQTGDAAKKLSQVKYGEKYMTKDGQVMPYTMGGLVEFQLTGLIVVIVVLAGLSLICAAIGRLIKSLDKGSAVLPAASAAAPIPASRSIPASGIHPGLTDQQLVALLTAAASEMLANPVRIEQFQPQNTSDLNWVAQGRSELHTHRLK